MTSTAATLRAAWERISEESRWCRGTMWKGKDRDNPDQCCALMALRLAAGCPNYHAAGIEEYTNALRVLLLAVSRLFPGTGSVAAVNDSLGYRAVGELYALAIRLAEEEQGD